jgi:hypothetical protein
VLRIHADDANYALAVNDFALVADFLDGCPYFHISTLLLFQKPGNAPARTIERRQFHFNAISGPQPHKVGDGGPRKVRDCFLPGFQFETVRYARQGFYYYSRHPTPVSISLIGLG